MPILTFAMPDHESRVPCCPPFFIGFAPSCEPSSLNNRQYNYRVSPAHPGLCCMLRASPSRTSCALVVMALAVSAGAVAQPATSVVSPESALELMQHGDCTGAWKQFEKLRR